MKTIDEIREAFLRVHRVAIGESQRSYMSIPPRPDHDADLIVMDAIDELARLRGRPATRDTVLELTQRTCEHEFKVRAGERVVCRDCTAEVAT